MNKSLSSSQLPTKYRFIPPSKIAQVKQSQKQNLHKPEVKPQKQVNSEHLSRLTQHIQQLRYEQQDNLLEISEWKGKYQEMRNKYEECVKGLVHKNTQINELKQRIKNSQRHQKDKCEEHTLIIQSLKRVIESQKVKIEELESRVADGNHELSSGREQHPVITPVFSPNPSPKNHTRSCLSPIDESEEQETGRESYEGSSRIGHESEHERLMEEINEYLMKWHEG